MGEAASSEVTQVAAATSSQDPEVGLAAVAALRGLVEVLEALQVENARGQGLVLAADRGPPRRHQTGRAPQVRRPTLRLSEVATVAQGNDHANRVLDLAR